MQKKQDNGLLNNNDCFNILTASAYTCAAMVSPVIRYGNGKNAPGVFAGFAFLALLFFTRDQASYYYIHLWVAMLLYRRVVSMFFSPMTHTRFWGYPIFSLFERGQYLQEIATCWLIGMYSPSEMLGNIFMFGTAGLSYMAMTQFVLTRKRDDAIRDAYLEAENLA